MGFSRNLQLVLEKLFGDKDIYVVTESPTSFFVDKLHRDENKLTKTRYVVQPAGWTCTCKGYQHRGRCKHQDMCQGVWSGTGAPRAHVATFVRDVLDELTGTTSVPADVPDDLPNLMKNVSIRLTNFESKAIILVCKGFGSNESCVFEFVPDNGDK